MLTLSEAARWFSLSRAQIAFGIVLGCTLNLRAASPAFSSNTVEVLTIQGTVEVARAGQTVWDIAPTQLPYRRLNPGDQIRTKDRSRTTIRLSDLTIVELGPNSHFEVLPVSEQKPGFSFLRGLLYLFHRNKPGEFYFRTPTASPVVRGTEFALEVGQAGETVLHLLEGEVTLTNDFGGIDLTSGESAFVARGSPPTRRAGFDAVSIIQWCLYYPAVLHLPEIELDAEAQNTLADSLSAYRRGDPVRALALYPPNRQPGSGSEKSYLAALLLAVGEVENSEAVLKSLSGGDTKVVHLAIALRTMIAAVKRLPMSVPALASDSSGLASSLLADSYYFQSRFELEQARAAARKSVEIAPDFGFGWARVAELEFSFGQTHAATKAINRALELAPANAQALATAGFLLAGENRIDAALEQFERAITTDGALANAWLGRGLCRIQKSQTRDGARDLLVAAALEPNRAVLRSYLGKALHQTGDEQHAVKELELARQLDPRDPTSWLYAALVDQQRNRINDAIRELEQSQDLNDNRQLYRSRLLLDEDRAVRQANLASIYQDAGLFEQSIREASQAVGTDYANYSAHLFLANSYSQMRGNNLVTLRYETATLSEYLVAQLLAPVGGSALSSYVSQQEYSKLFQQQGFGFSSGTEYLSRGDWQQRAVQYGTFRNFDYALDVYYALQNGQQPNNDFELFSFSPAARFQVSPQDTLFLQIVQTKFESGDLRQYRDPSAADKGVRIKESQEPNIFAGYHREWNPGSHTLLLAARLSDDFRFRDDDLTLFTVRRGSTNTIVGRVLEPFSHFAEQQHSEFNAYSLELQQLWQTARNTLIVGGRYQDGETHSEIELTKLSPSVGLEYPTNMKTDTALRRGVVYAYDHWELLEQFWVIGGLSYDWLSFPENIDAPPISERQTEKEQISPKAGVLWMPIKDMVFRGAYTRSLGGLFYDNSVRLEPVQVAGFNQAYRSLIPESVEATAPGSEFEAANFDLSWSLPSGTYLGVGGEWLRCDGDHTSAVFESSTTNQPVITELPVRKNVDFDEKSLIANLNQLVGRDWALGARYRMSDASLNDHPTGEAAPVLGRAIVDSSARLHQMMLFSKFTHPSGFFAEVQALWNAQESETLDHSGPVSRFVAANDDFWQFNLFAGYRFPRRQVELLVGGLNLSDQDYRLEPINLHAELPRGRTLLVSFKFNF